MGSEVSRYFCYSCGKIFDIIGKEADVMSIESCPFCNKSFGVMVVSNSKIKSDKEEIDLKIEAIK